MLPASVLLVAPLLLVAFPAVAGIPCCCLHSLPLLAFLAAAGVSAVADVFSIPRLFTGIVGFLAV